MTDTSTSEAPATVQPDGMPPELWSLISDGLACHMGSTGRALADKLLAQWLTNVQQGEQHARVVTGFQERHANLTTSSNERIAQLQKHLDTIAQCLLDEAENRNWCSEYDEFADRVNGLLGSEVLLPCSRNYEVTFAVSVTVNARGSDAAQEEAESDLESALARAGFENYSFDHDSTSLEG